MQKHPLSYACAYTMLGALVVFGLAGVSTKYLDLLPMAWSPFILEWAPTATVVSLGLAFVAAAIASMRSAWHAERALQAGQAHRRIFWLALAYTAACIVIEVTIGKVGAYMIGKDVNTFALTALLTFFAIAPRVVSYILAGMDGIQREADEAEKSKENAHDLARLGIIESAREKSIRDGNIRRIEEARKAQAGAAVLMAAGSLVAGGIASDATPAHAAPVSEPGRESTVHSTADGSNQFDGPAEAEPSRRVRKQDAFRAVREADRLAEADRLDGRKPDVPTRRLAKAMGWSQSTAARSLRIARREGMLKDREWAWRWDAPQTGAPQRHARG